MLMNQASASNSTRPIQVLIIDDSAVVRQMLIEMLSRQTAIQAWTAADPLVALARMRQMKPDVILLDLELPRMDGLTFLRNLMETDPIPVVILSSLAGPGTEAALRALQEGALDIVTKPRMGIAEFLLESEILLVDTIRAAAGACLAPRKTWFSTAQSEQKQTPSLSVTSDRVVAVGASTGGTEALRQILEALPPDAPGMVIAQHMPAGFTTAFAKRLNESSRITVKEAEDGDRIFRGRALIGPGNFHTRVARDGMHYKVSVSHGPLISRHRPSVNALFHSVAESAGKNAVGILLTGMGDDGAEGMLRLKHVGAKTIAQDESSCVIFGMPRKAIELGAVDEVLPLNRIAAAVTDS
jgi:two-component system chemotaxis response regulator CheB